MAEANKSAGGKLGASDNGDSWPSDQFFEKIADELGVEALQPSGQRYLAELVSLIRVGLERSPKKDVLKGLRAARDQAVIERDGKARIGRPAQKRSVANRAQWALGKSGDAINDIDKAIERIKAEPRAPSRADWTRYFVIHSLAAAWGRRFPNACGSSMVTNCRNHTMRFSRPALGGEAYGPFLRCVRLILAEGGHPISANGAAKAIQQARKSNFAL